MQDIEVINMRAVTTGWIKNFTSFFKILYLIALRLPLPSFYLPKLIFYLSIHNPPFKCWTPPKLKFCLNVLRKLSLLLHSKLCLFTGNFAQCFRLNLKIIFLLSVLNPFLAQHNHFLLCLHRPCSLKLLIEPIDSPFYHHFYCLIATQSAFAIYVIVPG